MVHWGGGVCKKNKMHGGQGLCTTAFLRMLLCSLVRVKLGCYELEGKNSQSLEEYLKAFMETEVKPLWPKGWMQTRCLAFPPAVCSFLTKMFFFVFIYTYIFVCPTGFYSKRALWLTVTSQATRELCLSCLVFFLSCFEVRFFEFFFFKISLTY